MLYYYAILAITYTNNYSLVASHTTITCLYDQTISHGNDIRCYYHNIYIYCYIIIITTCTTRTLCCFLYYYITSLSLLITNTTINAISHHHCTRMCPIINVSMLIVILLYLYNILSVADCT